jgi:acetyl-CoA carboxylase biotin carboxyl carrier protein
VERIAMTSPLDQVATIGAWLAATDIEKLDLTGPDGHLRLRRGGKPPAVPARDGPEEAVAGPRGGSMGDAVASPGFGLFLHAHPLRDAPLVRPGDRVMAGQVLGLLKIGALLLPVRTPREGVVEAVLAAEGSLVGFGDPLVALSVPA